MMRGIGNTSKYLRPGLANDLPAGKPAHARLPPLIAAGLVTGYAHLTSFVGRHLAQKSLAPSLNHEPTLCRIPFRCGRPEGVAHRPGLFLEPLPRLEVRRNSNASENRRHTAENKRNLHTAMLNKRRAHANSTDDLRSFLNPHGTPKAA